MSDTETGYEDFVFYAYRPSLPAAVIFAVLFLGSASWHLVQLTRHRTWYFIPFVIGCLFEGVGYIGRILSWKEHPDFTMNPFIIQSLLLLLGPALFAASIYMILGRLIVRLEAPHHSIVRPKWLTKIFVTGDVLSFCVQGGGGGMLARAEDRSAARMGENIILAGLGIQILCFGLFVVATVIFHRRIDAAPTPRSIGLKTPWRKLLWVLYASSALIIVRSVFRIVEYVMGSDGELLQKEFYLFVFDGVPMLFTAVAFNWFHPSRVITKAGDELEVASVTSLEVMGSGEEGGRRKEMYRDVESQGGFGDYAGGGRRRGHHPEPSVTSQGYSAVQATSPRRGV